MRAAVEAMPRFAREAMLRGIDANQIIAGAYTDPKTGGICPMLAAHRNGGRTSLASFARCWDRYTDARRPRLATDREITALRSYLELSLVGEPEGGQSLVAAAERIRSEREQAPKRRRVIDGRPTGDTFRATELGRRSRWAWILPTRRYDVYKQRVAAASEQLSEQRAREICGPGSAQTDIPEPSPSRAKTTSGIKQ